MALIRKEMTNTSSHTLSHTLSARDRGRIDEIIKALKFLEEDKMLCYADEIDFLKRIRQW